MQRVRTGSPISKHEFHIRLGEWLGGTDEPSIGGQDVGVQAWIIIQDGDQLFRLNADTKREGVERYFLLVEQFGHDLEWTPMIGRGGSQKAVAFGPNKVRPRYFYLYRRK